MALLAAAMVGLAFASVPLYRMFCQVTGFGGTPMRAPATRRARSARPTIGVRFDANIAPTLPWRFEPAQDRTVASIGARDMALYRAKNLTARPITGTAIFNVTPAQAGQYFTKIECFCFTEQTLKPGQEVDMPVVFFVDPKILDDPDDAATSTRSRLSYTFYPVETAGARPARARAASNEESIDMAASQEPRLSHPADPIPGRSSARSRRSPCSAGW